MLICLFASSISIPKSQREAPSYPTWRQAMIDEICTLQSSGTWCLFLKGNLLSAVGGSTRLRLALMAILANIWVIILGRKKWTANLEFTIYNF